MSEDVDQLRGLRERGLLTADEYRAALEQLPPSPSGDTPDELAAADPSSAVAVSDEPAETRQSALRRWAPVAVAAVVVLVGLAGVAWLQRDVPVEPVAEVTEALAQEPDDAEEPAPEIDDEVEVEAAEPEEEAPAADEADDPDELMDALSRNPGPDEVSTWLLKAWARDSRAEAEVVAGPEVVDALFGRTPPAGVVTPSRVDCEDLGMYVTTPPFTGVNHAVRCTLTFGDETIITSVEGGPSLGFYIVGVTFGDEPLPSPVTLRGDGLGVATLGQSESDVRATLEGHLGGPDETFEECPGDWVARWGALMVSFTDGVFVNYYLGWSEDARASPLTTDRGISMGSSRAEVEALYGADVEITTWRLWDDFPEETGFTISEPEGQLLGDLDGPDADSEVVGLFAGERHCGDL